MAISQKLSEHLNIPKEKFEELGIFDPFIGVDTHLFLDPALLRNVEIAEFKTSYNKLAEHFSNVLKLLSKSKAEGDIAWREAVRRLTFKETKGISIGYGAETSDGSAIGSDFAKKIAKTAVEIINIGVQDPSIFELICLFEEGLGADRLSDMTISIIIEDVYAYTSNSVKRLGLTPDQTVESTSPKTGTKYTLVKNPEGTNHLLLLPKDLLKDLPMALSRDDIGFIVYFNDQLRRKLNSLIIQDAAESLKDFTKAQYKEIFLNEEFAPQIVESYLKHKPEKYDFKKDPSSETRWYDDGQKFAKDHPLSIDIKQPKTLDDVNEIVRNIINQFQRSIEHNELKELLYKEPVSKLKPRNERYSQRLFYSIADTYCRANNVVLSREPNAGNGPVDFKIAQDYSTQVLVEIKLSSGKVRTGFEKQLPEYEKNENANKSFLVIIKVSQSSKQIDDVMKMYDQAIKDKRSVPEVIVIDAIPRESASKPKRKKR